MVGIKDFDMPSCCNSCGHWSFNRDDEPLCDLTYEYIKQFDKRQDDCPLVKAIPKADYENRLKADIEAILVELQTEIEEYKRDLSNKDITKDHEDFDHNNPIEVISGIIQQKINLLKEK